MFPLKQRRVFMGVFLVYSSTTFKLGKQEMNTNKCRLVIFVGDDKSAVARSCEEMTGGVTGLKRNRADIFRVSLCYEAGQFLAWMRLWEQSETNVLVIVMGSTLELDHDIICSIRYSGNESHEASLLGAGVTRVKAPRTRFLHRRKARSDGQLPYVWEDEMLRWTEGDPRKDKVNGIRLFEHHLNHFACRVVTCEKDVALLLPSDTLCSNANDVRSVVEKFYAS